MAWLAVLAACTADPGGASKTEPTVPPDAPVCALAADNTLRLTCSGTGPGSLRFAASDVDRAVAVAEAGAWTVPAWGFPPETDLEVTWTPDGGSAVPAGTVSTGALPARFAVNVAVTATGEETVGYVLLNYGCDGSDDLLALDPSGRVVWYQDSTLQFPPAISRTTRGWVVAGDEISATYDRDLVVSWSLAGEVRAAYGADVLPGLVHHDVGRRGDELLALFAEQYLATDGRTYVIDGFAVYDGAGEHTGTFRLSDAFEPAPIQSGGYWADAFPGAIDWGHVNALHAADDGLVVMSLHTMDVVIGVVGDPADPAFGTVVWRLGGSPAAAQVGSDLALVSDVTTDLGFENQHHAWSPAPGELMLFDNGNGEESRVLRLAIDEVAGTAEISTVWPLGRACEGQGSGSLLPSGNLLADCAPDDTLLEVDTATDAVVWEATVSCPGDPMLRPLYRAVPVNL